MLSRSRKLSVITNMDARSSSGRVGRSPLGSDSVKQRRQRNWMLIVLFALCLIFVIQFASINDYDPRKSFDEESKTKLQSQAQQNRKVFNPGDDKESTQSPTSSTSSSSDDDDDSSSTSAPSSNSTSKGEGVATTPKRPTTDAIESVPSQHNDDDDDDDSNAAAGQQRDEPPPALVGVTPLDIPYEVTTTHFGWTTPADKNFSKRIVTSEFFDAVQAHPRYSPNALNEAEANPLRNQNRTLVVFLDVDTCMDTLYPVYGVGRKWWLNADTKDGRHSGGGYLGPVTSSCDYIVNASRSIGLRANPLNRLVVLDCGGFVKQQLKSICQKKSGFSDVVLGNNKQVMFASYASTNRQSRNGIDIGLVPPAIKPVELTDQEREDIRNCKTRKWLFSFQGQPANGRIRMKPLENETDMYVRLVERRSYKADLAGNSSTDAMGFKTLIKNSLFGGVPRGDALYSYRLVETMSAGTIPVVYADDWLRPFHPGVVDWEACAVFIPEKNMAQTGEILRKIPAEQVCEMQQAVLRVWDNYASSRVGWVNGLVESALVSGMG